jgi:hypothetical protein
MDASDTSNELSSACSHQQVFDRAGRPYEMFVVLDGPISRFRLYEGLDKDQNERQNERQILVGEAKCVRQSQTRWELGDIAIANAVIPIPVSPIPASPIPIHGLSHPTPVNYRGRGLGTVLLKCLVEHARSQGAQELWGEVFQQDIENDPKLLNWYQTFGFERHPPSGDVAEDVVALICLTLN